MSTWEHKDQYLESVYKKHTIADKRLRNASFIDTKQFNKAVFEYLQSTEQLIVTLDKHLSIQRSKPYTAPKSIKKFNRGSLSSFNCYWVLAAAILTVSIFLIRIAFAG